MLECDRSGMLTVIDWEFRVEVSCEYNANRTASNPANGLWRLTLER